FVEREHPTGLGRVVHHRDDDLAKQLHGLLDDIEMTEVERVEAARVQHRESGVRGHAPAHATRSSCVTQVRPYRRERSASHPVGGAISRPASATTKGRYRGVSHCAHPATPYSGTIV